MRTKTKQHNNKRTFKQENKATIHKKLYMYTHCIKIFFYFGNQILETKIKLIQAFLNIKMSSLYLLKKRQYQFC